MVIIRNYGEENVTGWLHLLMKILEEKTQSRLASLLSSKLVPFPSEMKLRGH